MLTGAITADPFGILAAFGAGILSFISPCVLPLVPGYLSMVSGLSAVELSSARRSSSVTGSPAAGALGHGSVLTYPAAAPAIAGGGGGVKVAAPAIAPPSPAPPPPAVAGRRPLKPLLRGILLFVAGFTIVFVALGAVASGVGELLNGHKYALTMAAGAVVVVLGAVMLASAMPASLWMRLGGRVSGRMGWLLGERRVHLRPETLGSWAAPVMGMAFAVAWTPCLGPVLGAVVAMASFRSTLAGGVVLLFAYSLGLGVPFLVTGVAFDRLTGFYARARRRLALVQVVAAAVLVAFGALLLAGDLSWLSSLFSTALNDLGLHRLTVS